MRSLVSPLDFAQLLLFILFISDEECLSTVLFKKGIQANTTHEKKLYNIIMQGLAKEKKLEQLESLSWAVKKLLYISEIF